MMKSWLVFVGGGMCGVLLTLAAVRVNSRIVQPPAEAMRVVETENDATAAGKRLPGENEDGGSLDAKIVRLKTAVAERRTVTNFGEMYETLGLWSQRDPRAVLAWIDGAERFPQRLSALAVALAELAREDAAEAIRWIYERVPSEDWREVAQSTVGDLEYRDPRAALALAFLFPEENRPDDLGTALGALVTKSPQEALNYFARLTGDQREHSARELVVRWAEASPEAALAWCEGQPELLADDSVRHGLLQGLMETRPELCVEMLGKFSSEGPGSFVAADVVRQLLERSPEHGVNALRVVSAEAAAQGLGMWVGGCFELDPARAIGLVTAWVPEKERSEVLGHGFESWLQSDQRSALAWFATVTQPEVRTALEPGWMAWRLRRDPEAVRAILSDPRMATPEFRGVVERAFDHWMDRDAAGAAQWLQANPGMVTADQTAQLAGVYLNQDEEAGAMWLARLPAGESRDAAAGAAAAFWAGEGEQGLAGEVVRSIRDPERRTRAIFDVYQGINYSDPAAAERWLGEQEISEELARSWRAIVGRR